MLRLDGRLERLLSHSDAADDEFLVEVLDQLLHTLREGQASVVFLVLSGHRFTGQVEASFQILALAEALDVLLDEVRLLTFVRLHELAKVRILVIRRLLPCALVRHRGNG